jgi:choline dehydrogenase
MDRIAGGYRAVVVGGGSAGSVVARRLSDGTDGPVLLLEAGPAFHGVDGFPTPLRESYFGGQGPRASLEVSLARVQAARRARYEWPYWAQPTPEAAPTPLARGRVLGGSSAVNAQIYLHGLPEDYDRWGRRAGPEWGREPLQACLRAIETDCEFGAEPYHGGRGPIPVTRYPRDRWALEQAAFETACLEAGHPACPDHNRPGRLGVGPIPFNGRPGLRVNAAMAYLDTADRAPNLEIQGNAQVVRVLVEGGRARGVEYLRDGVVRTARADEVVLCGGVVGSPHVLMLSGVGEAAHLRRHGIPVVNDLPGVGRGLIDHPALPLSFAPTDRVVVTEMPTGCQLTLRCTTGVDGTAGDMMILMISFSTLRTDRGSYACDRPAVSMIVHIMEAVSTGEIRLAGPDPARPPRIDLRYLTEPADLTRHRAAMRVAHEISRRPAFRAVGDRLQHPPLEWLASDRDLDRWLRAEAVIGQHLAGTCRMGPAGDAGAVVDAHARVHGLGGLRVVDASILPANVRANTNASVLALAERAAQLILRDWAS